MRLGRLERLLSGYAAGTLSDEERRALFEAALEDQAVFEALAREQSLKELLDDAGARQAVLEALGNVEPPVRQVILRWVVRPRVWAAAGCTAAIVLAVALLMSERPEPPRQIAARRGAPAPAGGPMVPEVQAPEREAAPAPEAPVRGTAKKQTIAAQRSRAMAGHEFRTAAEPPPGPGVAPTAETAGARSATGSPVAQPLSRVPPPAAFIATPARSGEQAAPPEALGVVLYRRAAGGEFVATDLETVLHPGDEIRFAVLPPADGILTAMLEEGGARRPLFRGPVRKGERRLIPEGEPIVLGGEPGDRRLLLVLGAQGLSLQAGGVKAPSAADVSVPITVEVPLRYRSEP